MFYLLLKSAYTASKPFLPLRLPSQRAGQGCTRGWEGTQLGQLTPADLRDIPYHMMCSAMKSQVCRGKQGLPLLGDLVGDEQLFSFASVSLVFLGFIFLSLLFWGVGFFFLIELSSSQPMIFLIFTLPILTPIPLDGGMVSDSCVVLSCQPGLNHDSNARITVI